MHGNLIHYSSVVWCTMKKNAWDFDPERLATLSEAPKLDCVCVRATARRWSEATPPSLRTESPVRTKPRRSFGTHLIYGVQYPMT